ncbi:MAG: hypothetical protein ABIH46_11265 [Chloroflexota bacterium]
MRKLEIKISQCASQCPHWKLGRLGKDRYVYCYCRLAKRDFDWDRPIQERVGIPNWCPLPTWEDKP